MIMVSQRSRANAQIQALPAVGRPGAGWLKSSDGEPAIAFDEPLKPSGRDDGEN
jgi:hypothetical protein